MNVSTRLRIADIARDCERNLVEAARRDQSGDVAGADQCRWEAALDAEAAHELAVAVPTGDHWS